VSDAAGALRGPGRGPQGEVNTGRGGTEGNGSGWPGTLHNADISAWRGTHVLARFGSLRYGPGGKIRARPSSNSAFTQFKVVGLTGFEPATSGL
jgi:hypothetical protein